MKQTTSPHYPVLYAICLLTALFSLVACRDEISQNPATGYFILPHIESRLYAMVNLAMYDALNTIQKKHTPFALQST